MKTVSLDIHDFSVLHNRMDLLLKIKEHYPDFKVSMFTIPFDYPNETGQHRVLRETELKKIRENLDWIQIIPHGLTHMANEFEKCDYYTMRDLVLPSIDEAFKKDLLPYEKGFCAPFWLWNPEVCRALDNAGWWGAIDRNQPNMDRTKKTYTYSHSIEEPFWLSDKETLKLHGHIGRPSANALGDCLLNIMKLDPDVKWVFCTDFIENEERG